MPPRKMLSDAVKVDGRFTCEGCGKLLGRTAWFDHRRLQCGQSDLADNPAAPGRLPPHVQQTLAHDGHSQGMLEPADEEMEVTGGSGQMGEDVQDNGDIGDQYRAFLRVPVDMTGPSTESEPSTPDVRHDIPQQVADPSPAPSLPPPDRGSLADLSYEDAEAEGLDIHDDDLSSGVEEEEDEGEDENPDEDPEVSQRPTARTEEFRIAELFIDALRSASLDNDPIPAAIIDRLRNPPTEELKLTDPALRFSLEMYIQDLPESAYNKTRISLLKNFGIEILSYDQIKRKVEEISGIHPVFNDMCVKSCLGFVGPFADYRQCPTCGEHRYDQAVLASKGKEVPRKRFLTNLIGPQIQAAYRSPDSALDMSYRSRCTEKVMQDLESNGGISEWSDYIHGTEYIDAVQRGDITSSDTVLMLSLDGAQLYQNKQSDCWMYIWIFLDRAPETRYKKQHVMIGGVIPGPDKPKNIDSFLFPGFHHLAALMRDGIVIWDAAKNITFTSRPFLAFLTADGPGMTYLNGLVGHSGAQGCRLYCKLKGRHKPGLGIYYPVLQKPRDYNVTGCDHDDVDLPELASRSYSEAINDYHTNLEYVRNSATVRQYRQRRLQTGISKPSIVSGLPPDRVFPMPGCFPADLMHLASLNITDLIISLLRGTMQCDTGAGDDKRFWDWAVFRHADVWQVHGQAVANVIPYLPGSFDRPPRNPAEKIKSGYKAIEFLTYVFGLGPALFHGILPDKFWRNFCKLVRGIRLVHQKHIQEAELVEAHKLLIEFSIEFEDLYCQRHPGRLHFVRQAVHALCHICMEIIRIGPYAGVTQWTMERAIGDLGQEIRQPSNPFANLAQRALRRCQVNAIRAMVPGIDNEPPPSTLPRGAHALENGYVLLRACDIYLHTLTSTEADILVNFLLEAQAETVPAWLQKPKVSRWARLRLPNGQIARTLWKESEKPLDRVRISRNVKLLRENVTHFAEVHWFFKIALHASEPERGFAFVDIYGPPDRQLLLQSSNTLWSCSRQENNRGFAIVPVEDILSVVAVIPHHVTAGALETQAPRSFYVVEKIGLDVMMMAGFGEEMDEESDVDSPVPTASVT